MTLKTDPEQLLKAYKCLKKSPYTPKDWEPWLFGCQKESKAPLEGVSWKSKRAFLSINRALTYLKKGYNIGIAGRKDGPLTIVDKDDPNAFDVFITTLTVRTRSRKGLHYYLLCENEIPNITPEFGEVRSQWEYCLAPGSYVPTPKDKVPKNERENAGKYTIETYVITMPIFNELDLPKPFYDYLKESEKKTGEIPEPAGFDPAETEGDHSALFDLEVKDIVKFFDKNKNPAKRWTLDPSDSAIKPRFHEDSSTTDANMSISYKTRNENGEMEEIEGGILRCWRHLVGHGPIQVLTVLSGYMSCPEAGTSHKDGTNGPSQVTGDDGAIFHAWKYAKEKGLIPEDDPVPTRGLKHIARKHDVYDAKENEMLPKGAYHRTLHILEEDY